MSLGFGGGLFDIRDDEGRKKIESYLSIPPPMFRSVTPATDALIVSTNWVQAGASIQLRIPVLLPDRATITSCSVTGNVSNRTWTFSEINNAGGATNIIAQELLNTIGIIHSTIGEVDNLNRGYVIGVNIENTDRVYLVVITYTI